MHDVLLKAMAKKITWWEAVEIIGVMERTMRRWRERLAIGGYSGLVDRRKARPSDKRVPVAQVEEVPRLYTRRPDSSTSMVNPEQDNERMARWQRELGPDKKPYLDD